MHFMTRTVCYRLCHTQTVTPTLKWLTVWHGCGFIGTLLAIMMQVALTQTDHAWDGHMFMFGPAHNSLLRPTSGHERETLSPSCAWVDMGLVTSCIRVNSDARVLLLAGWQTLSALQPSSDYDIVTNMEKIWRGMMKNDVKMFERRNMNSGRCQKKTRQGKKETPRWCHSLDVDTQCKVELLVRPGAGV